MPAVPPSLADARRFLALLARPGDVYELRGLVRVQGQQHTTSGFFDDPELLARAACHRSGQDDGVYLTLNPVHSGLLARRAKNRVERAGSGDTTSDRDVRQRRSILIDVDPVRPAGISSTDAEHDAAIALARKIRDALAEIGWPAPILADSGNGGHLIYAVDLPVDDGGLVQRVLAALGRKFSSPDLKIDEKVFNPARISKIYGTLTRKGQDTPDRPHRLARILEAPDVLGEVPRDALEAFAVPADSKGLRELKRKVDGYVAERNAFDVDAFLAQHLPDAKERPWSEGRRWILPVCPFNDAHDRGEAYVCRMHSGALAAGCQHESCRWGWRDLRERFEPGAYDRTLGGSVVVQHSTVRTAGDAPPQVLYEDERYRAEIDAFADRDREPAASVDAVPSAPEPVPWRMLPSLGAEIRARAADPWVELRLVDDSLARVRTGGIAVLIGGSGSGKSSLTSCLLYQHALHVGPAIALSIELPADELAARIVGIRCDLSWEDALCARNILPSEMDRVLNLPRFYVLDRRRATIANLEKCVDAARAEYPGQPILVAIDYSQLLDSKEREMRNRVGDAFGQIDDCAREKKFVALALSQMSRVNAKRARDGEAIGAESAELGAETAAIERFATVTLTIGKMGEPREDGSRSVELSTGKSRMGDASDSVREMSYVGRSGLWRCAGEAKAATKVREHRELEKNEKADRTIEAALLGVAAKSPEPLTKGDLKKQITGNAQRKTSAISRLLHSKELVEVLVRASKGAKKNDWKVWTPDRARDAGIQLVESLLQGDLPV